MADYIKRDALLEARELAICAYENAGVFNADAIRNRLKPLLDAVADTPAADVAEVVHGRWIDGAEDFTCGNHNAECSICRCYVSWDGCDEDFNYCPNCGARMDGGEDRAVS